MLPLRKPVLKKVKQIMSVATIYLIPLALPKQVVIQGPGSVKQIPRLLTENGLKKPLIVTDQVLMELNVLDTLFKAFGKIGMKYVVYDYVEQNPTIENIEEAYSLYKRKKFDSIIGFGGGSSMDCAKVVSGRVLKPKTMTTKMRGYMKIMLPIPKPRPYLAVVPTTAGTGAETTVASVVSDHILDVKFTVNDFLLRPKTVILDAELTRGLPPFATACTAVDALSHCIEGYIGTAHSQKSDEFAEKAIKMIFENIDKAYTNGDDLEARSKLLLSAYYGGLCLNYSLTGYVHPFCHKIGAKYNMVHGRLIGAVMPAILEYYGPAVYERLAKLADLIGVSAPNMTVDLKAKAFIEALRDYDRKYYIGLCVPEIQERDFKEIAKSIHKECIPYPVPVIFDDDDVFELLRKIKGV